MATILGKLTGRVTGKVAELQKDLSNVTQSPLNKLWRVLIIHNRNTSPMPKVDRSDPKSSTATDDLNKHYARKDSFSIAQRNDPWKGNQIQNIEAGREPGDLSSTSKNYTKPSVQRQFNNEIIIINRNTTPATSLILQNRPNQLEINPQTTWAKVKSMGRNNPFLMYTGGEDTITLQISWYASDESNRREVVNKCRLLESWSKANGYISSPPTLEIIWGSSELFLNDQFILESAVYKLENFQNSTKDSSGNQIDLKLLPNSATQTLVFNRVTSGNRTHNEIVPEEALKLTKGITFNQ